jgi:hypothetical protein
VSYTYHTTNTSHDSCSTNQSSPRNGSCTSHLLYSVPIACSAPPPLLPASSLHPHLHYSYSHPYQHSLSHLLPRARGGGGGSGLSLLTASPHSQPQGRGTIYGVNTWRVPALAGNGTATARQASLRSHKQAFCHTSLYLPNILGLALGVSPAPSTPPFAAPSVLGEWKCGGLPLPLLLAPHRHPHPLLATPIPGGITS